MGTAQLVSKLLHFMLLHYQNVSVPTVKVQEGVEIYLYPILNLDTK